MFIQGSEKELEMSDKEKADLIDGIGVYPSRYYQTNVTYNTTLVWRISDYENLSYNVMHYQAYEDEKRKCILRIFKHKNVLHLGLSSPSIFKNMLAEFSIINETNHKSIAEKAHQICDGVYVGKFSNEQFLFPGSNFLSKGTLTIAFKYVSSYVTLNKSVNAEGPEELTNCDELCYDFKTMYLEALYPDFLIHVNDYTFKCHKLILVGRSKLFATFLQQDKNQREYRMPENNLPGIVHQVLLYMYCGELMEMDMECMLHVYKTAEFLKISTLCKRCLEYVETAIDYDNHKEACEFAVKNNLTDLKNVIIRTFNEQFPDYNIIAVFKQLQKEKNIGEVEKVFEKTR